MLERHLRTYYGHLARSRLVEMRKLALESTRCAAPATERPRGVGARLTALAKRHGDVLPDLGRAAIMWRAGLHDEARRELRNIALDMTWVFYRGRYHAYRIRPWVARIWRGRGPDAKRWTLTKSQKRLAQLDRRERRELLHELGPTFTDAGLGYYGWRFSPPVRNNMKRYYPRAFGRLVARAARRYALDANLMWAIMRTESGYRPDAISPVYAGGLMQVMPYTATRLASELQLERFDLLHVFRPRTNLELSAHYLRAVSSKFQGQVPLVAAAYNGGPHNVRRWMRDHSPDMPMDAFLERIPFNQTHRYVRRV
ncbi:MAG: lytic transglycosylase domain-containing protein, partial [Myxococcales bacterium]|nr:lytic transglycosylase domain-containing protein [Myxococcales bacterium]